MTFRLSNAQPLLKDVVPPRHRRKKRDEDTTTNSQNVQTQTKELLNSRGAQFDLVEEAFPPLPGMNGTFILQFNYLDNNQDNRWKF